MDINNYCIFEIPTKGHGLVATRDLKRGEQILNEEPIFVVAIRTFENELSLDLSESFMANCLKLVTKEQREKFESLTNSMNDKYPQRPNTGRYLTNNLPLQPPWVSKKKTKKSGIFLEASRVNHSCYPNANWCWNPKSGKGTLCAIKDIPAGAEIVRSYFEVASRTKRQRQEMCYQLWQFICNCPMCSLCPNRTAEADAHFSKVGELEVALQDYARIRTRPQASLADALTIHKTLVRYLPLTSEFGKILYKAFEITAYHGDRPRATGFLEGALDTCYHAEGMDSPNVRYFQLLRDNLENYRFLEQSDKWAPTKEDVPSLEGSIEWLEWLWRFGAKWYDNEVDERGSLDDETIVCKEVSFTEQKVIPKKKENVGVKQNLVNKKENISLKENMNDKKEHVAMETTLKRMDMLTMEENVAKEEGALAEKKN